MLPVLFHFLGGFYWRKKIENQKFTKRNCRKEFEEKKWVEQIWRKKLRGKKYLWKKDWEKNIVENNFEKKTIDKKLLWNFFLDYIYFSFQMHKQYRACTKNKIAASISCSKYSDFLVQISMWIINLSAVIIKDILKCKCYEIIEVNLYQKWEKIRVCTSCFDGVVYYSSFSS